jgi:hypothetical protein
MSLAMINSLSIWFLTKLYYFFILLSVLLFLNSCNTTEPIQEKIYTPGSYKWSIDTLKNSYITDLHKIWGLSPTDLYICGYNRDETKPPLWHFDGNSWMNVVLPVQAHFINDIYGFSSDDIWAVGAGILPEKNNLIIHFNGNNWEDYSTTGNGWLNSIWGNSPNNIWAGGLNELLHFDGLSWQKVNISMPPRWGGEFGLLPEFISISGMSENDVYATVGYNAGMTPHEGSYYYIYHFNGNSWSVIDSTLFISFNGKFGVRLKTIEKSIYSFSWGLFKMEGNNWVALYDDNLIDSFGGLDMDFLFASSIKDLLYFYNGNDWTRFIINDNFHSSLIMDFWTNKNEVFMVGSDGKQSFVVHGK